MYGKSTSIDNSIPQNTKSVKSNTTTNKQSMQNNKNNTQNTEGNEVKSMKKKSNKTTLSDEQIRNIVKYNPDGKEIKDTDYVDFMIERFKDRSNISDVETTTSEINTLLNETLEDAKNKVGTSEANKIRNKQKELMIDKLYSKIKNKKFKVTKKLKSENGNIETKELDIEISKNGLKESFNKSISNEKYSVVPFLDKLIQTSNNGTIRNETKLRQNIEEWYYLYNTAIVDNQLYGVKIDIKKTGQGDRFYVHRLNIIKEGTLNSESIFKDDTIRNNKIPSSSNSISQNNQNVKDNGVRAMTKNNTIDNLMQNIISNERHNFKSNIKIDTKVVDQASTIPLNYKKAGQSTLSNLAKKLFSNLHKRVLNNKSEKIYVTNSDINESIAQTLKNPNQKAILKDNIAVFSQLDKIIENAKEIKSSDTEIVDNKARTQYKDYKYYYTQAYINGEKAWVQFDTRVQKGTTGKDERHFRLERIYKINEASSNGGTGNTPIAHFSNEPTSTNSIPQNAQNVKDNGVRAMKKNTSRSNTNATQTITTVDNQGRTLSRQQQEYFKDSKVRDEKGNLLTVYHTTTNVGEQFNIFDPRNTDFYRFGNQIVNYYTNSKSMSGSYADGSYEMAETSKNITNSKKVKRQYEGYINIINPYIIDAKASNWNNIKTEVNDYGKKLLNEIDVLEKNNIYDKLKEIYDNVEHTSQEASNKFFEIQGKASFEQYHILGEYARFGNIDNIYENGLFNEQGRLAISQHLNDKINGKTLKEIGLNLYNNKYETLLNKEIDKLKKQYPDIRNFPLEDIDIIAEHFDEGKTYIENRYKKQETTNDIVKKVIDMNNKGSNYDGIIIENVRDYGGGEVENYNPANVYVTFNSNQFKNADNTTPTSNQDIRFAKKTAKPKEEVIEPGQTNAQRESNYIEQEIRKIEQTGNWDNSIPVTKMTDIRKTIENYLGLGVQKGHFRQQAYGIYKGTRDVIRTKEVKDIDTILHETGHALDIGKRIELDKESISNELLKAVKKYGGYEAETREIQLEEGFAEVIREYTIVPEQAKIDYPQTVTVLEGIRQENKDFDNFIRTVQEQTYNYIHQNPRNRGGLSNQSIGERTDKMPLTPESIRQTIIENVWDSNYPLKRAVQVLQEKGGSKGLRASDNAYLLTRLASGIGDKVTSMLSNGYIDENGNRLFPGLSQLGEVLENNAERFNDLRAYLVAQRDLEYKAKGLKTGIRTSDSKAIIEQFKNDTQIQEASKIIYDTLDGVLQYAVNNKLITPENAQTLRESNAFYVPMQRVIGTNGNNVGRKGAVADIIKSRTGSELDIKDVLENIVANSANIIQQVENNKIINALYTQGENAGLTGSVYDEIDPPMKKVGVARLDVWQNELKNQGVDIEKIDFDKTMDIFVPNNNIDERNQIVSFIDNRGQRRYLQFKDELLFKTLTGLDRESVSRVLNFCEKLNKPLRFGATIGNLGFAIPNMLADTVQASIYSEAGFIPVIDTAIGALDVLSAKNKIVRNFMKEFAPQYAERVNNIYELYNQSGATSATRIGQERKSIQKIMKDIYGTKNSEVLGIPESFKPLKKLHDIMTYIPELSEQSTRFRAFEKNLEFYRRNGMAEIDARLEAALQSRDVSQDFSRMGRTMREINKIVPFSAARVGSIYTFSEKMKANPKRTSARIAVMLALNMLIKGLTADDDEIQELNQRKKDDNFVFKIGDQVITLKKPQGFLRSLINLNDYIIDLANGNIDEGKEGERLKDWLFNAIMDNSIADDITGMVPSAITPILENAINKDLYYNSDIVKSYDLDLPDSEQYYDYNSQLAIWLGQIFNYSPAKIDNFISGYFAGLGTQVTNIIDWIVSKTGATPEEPDMGLESNSVGKRFFVNVNSNSASVDEVYDLKTELTKKKNGGTITSEESQQLEDVTNATSEMAKLNKQIKEIKKDLTMSGEEKAEQIKLLQQQKTDTARQALGKELLYSENETNIESTTFYPSRNALSQNGYTLNLTADMKKEYEELAYTRYKQYENQGLYSEEKLEKLREKCKDYAKSQLLKKYKNDLIKSK